MKIEELPESLQDSVNITKPQEPSPPAATDLLTTALNAYASPTPTTNEDGSTTPALPPTLADMRNKTGAEILADLNTVPLFMTDLEENDGIEALKALAYEGTPAEVAQGFKERGNESFSEKSWRDAKEFYEKGINVLLIEIRKRQVAGKMREKMKGKEKLDGGEEAVDEEEVKLEIKILEACLVNRAACHLELKNYRSCTLDCGSVLRINSKHVKAFYRCSKALLALDRITEADDACARGLAIDPANKALQGVAKEIIKRNEIISTRKKRDLEREQRKRLTAVTLAAALKARNIKTRKTAQPPEMEDAAISLVPEPTDPTSTLSFPTVLLYPLHLESDFIKAFNETEPLSHHLSYILPLPWDNSGEYTPMGVECYMETVTGGLIKVGRKVPLLKVLSEGKVEIVDEVLRIFVVPKPKAAAWVQEFKSKKAAEKTSPG
ncbi:related to hsp90 chaperone complex associated protein CNS1 [Rhynchosporium graminicola]|uniref:Related to hsp90 chaperone complex associated protein CNS1 n=1 Tax=Rhynchosporium graminicola TaxID=2792576 RepID=A0A1E1KST9_9HELO|nr:related to hsp90 chaperone complex associated protein CNS1 [Rhynchosporium commune]